MTFRLRNEMFAQRGLPVYWLLFSAWTLVSLYNIASQDAQEDFTFVDEDDDSHMTWAEITVETYDVDPNDKSEFDTDSFRVRPPNGPFLTMANPNRIWGKLVSRSHKNQIHAYNIIDVNLVESILLKNENISFETK